MHRSIIGVDLGGTKVEAARLSGSKIVQRQKQLISSQGTEKQILDEIVQTTETVFQNDIKAIGIGVPSIVDVDKGIVYDVQNIPSWKEVHVKEVMEKHFNVPVFVNNDANCFAIGEKHFGQGQEYKNMIGLIVGTGMAAGIIIDSKLYNGHNCGAGEFGMIPYLESYYEHYCSGQFFNHFHKANGLELFQKAQKGDEDAIQIFDQFGHHLANAIITILFAVDPELIVLGGSVSKSYDFYKEALWQRLQSFPYSPTIDRLTIKISQHDNIALLGAAALCL